MTMNMATGAMGTLLPKLMELIKEEYKLKESVKQGVKSLEKEMKSMQAALSKVAEVPPDLLDEQVKLWAGEERELSFDMEDVVDKFLVRVDGDSKPASDSNKLKQLTKKMAGLFTKGKARHEIANAIKDIKEKVEEVANRRGRYTVGNIISRPAAVATDPRLRALYTEETEFVGIAGKRDQELMELLLKGENLSMKLKVVSVVGFGGLGKTTLVKTVYDKIKGGFNCKAFVPVGRNADAKKVFMDLLLDLGMYEHQITIMDERQLINKLRESLEKKRYLIVIDDIWDEKLWRVINCALSDRNNFGSRLITTTRIVSVAKLCCSSTNDSVYQMEPLSDADSKRLFYKRIFSHESGCPLEFEDVSTDVLKKCGGVPLAIITISSLLAGHQQVRPKHEWHVLLESIGHGLTEDPSVEEMLRILSFSYYDLPPHLKTCLLYLSMFPEDREIGKDRLIWMWIAENFIQCDKTRTSLFDIGENYFNELVNRSLIQPVYSNEGEIDGVVYACSVHDMVLDLICSLSSENNFVAILNSTEDIMFSQSSVRRLSLQKARNEEHRTRPLESASILQVRSIATFESSIDLVPAFSSFAVLRVLDLTGCDVTKHNHLNLRELGSLVHLRYLGLASTGISEVPKEVGKLKFLQVLDLSGNDDITELPSSVTKLRRLMCLLLESNCNGLPDGIGNLTSMEVLCEICGDSLSTVKELGNMERLRELEIWFDDLSLELEEAFVESLGKMSNIQSVNIDVRADYVSMDHLAECWVPPPSLREFITGEDVEFSILPACIRNNPSYLSQLSKLDIFVQELRQEDLECIGRLLALRCLELRSLRQRLLLVGADGFHCLTSFKLFPESPGQVVFLSGALAKTEQVALRISLGVAKEEATGNGGDCFDLAMGSLLSLRKVAVSFGRLGVTVPEAHQAMITLKNALVAHPKCPTFRICVWPSVLGGREQDVYNGPLEEASKPCAMHSTEGCIW